jgi:MFS transporter, ACS family, glucarate transporter
MHAGRFRVRWCIFGLMFAFGFIAYVQQKSLTIAASRMMPELGLSQLQIAWLEQALVLGYTISQVPMGVLGQRLGARVALVLYGMAGLCAALALPLVPELIRGPALFTSLLIIQVILGVAQGGRFPVETGVYSAWFPSRLWPLLLGIGTMALSLGAAVTAPLVATLMQAVGWQRALVWTTSPALLVYALWYWYGRDTPAEHPAVSSAELAEVADNPRPVAHVAGRGRVLAALSDRNTLLLTASYTLLNYCFYLLSNWCFLYLTQARHLSITQSGWLAMAPPLSAALGAGLGGITTARLCSRLGTTWGYRIVPLISLVLVAILLMTAVSVPSAYAAVAALTLCFGCVELTEASYFGAAMATARGNTMTVSATVNTGGNLGGLIALPVIGYLSSYYSWTLAFAVGCLAALASATFWLAINVGGSPDTSADELKPVAKPT